MLNIDQITNESGVQTLACYMKNEINNYTRNDKFIIIKFSELSL